MNGAMLLLWSLFIRRRGECRFVTRIIFPSPPRPSPFPPVRPRLYKYFQFTGRTLSLSLQALAPVPLCYSSPC
jgi:hypothetical protein